MIWQRWDWESKQDLFVALVNNEHNCIQPTFFFPAYLSIACNADKHVEKSDKKVSLSKTSRILHTLNTSPYNTKHGLDYLLLVNMSQYSSQRSRVQVINIMLLKILIVNRSSLSKYLSMQSACRRHCGREDLLLPRRTQPRPAVNGTD